MRRVVVLAVLMLGVWAGAAEACTLQPTGGTVTRTLGDRSYALNVPAGLPAGEAPLLLSLHGFGANSGVQETYTGWTPYAAAKKFIVAYPQARTQGSGAWDPYSSSSPDAAFLASVAADVAATWCVDPRRVHVDGWSNGAVMSQRAACAAAGTFASVSSYGGGSPFTACAPSRPISVALFAGQFDFTYGGLAQNTQQWRGLNACAATPAKTTDAYGSTDTYACAAGTQVVSRVVDNTSHNWPSGAIGEDQRNRLWAFFSAHPRP